MSTATAKVVRAVPRPRPVIDAPGLEVVPTPAPVRGFFGTVLVCLTLFLGALGVAFYLNTLMVQGAFELKNINVELSEVQAREATLSKDVIAVSTPSKLRTEAEHLGMAPATALLHLDVEAGVITGGKE